MLIELYEQSEVIRKNREAYEAEKRREEEEKRRREERKILYNGEVDMNDEKAAGFIDWAKKKADWYDPTVARKDELFGERNHEESEERKALKKVILLVVIHFKHKSIKPLALRV